MDRLDLFNPFRHKPTEHEDRLTWAFLVALKYEPLLQRFLRAAVLDTVPAGTFVGEWEWKPAEVRTQIDRLESGASFVVSVVLSNERLKTRVPVKWVDRRPRYDGTVHYADGLVLVIENKPLRENVSTSQLSLSRESAGDEAELPDLHDEAVSITWPQILEALLEYDQSPVASYTGRLMAQDLLALVEETRPELNPYRTFDLCGNVEAAVRKRVSLLVRELGQRTGLEVGERRGEPFLRRPKAIAQEAHFLVQSGSAGVVAVRQALWPADTITQARRFFDTVDREALFRLEDTGWAVVPNLHFSFMGTHLVWATTTMPVSQYFELFASGEVRYGQWSTGDPHLREALSDWMEGGLLAEDDREQLIRHFLGTRRDHVNVIPGFGVSIAWTIEELARLEQAEGLSSRLIESFGTALATWGESMAVAGHEQTTLEREGPG